MSSTPNIDVVQLQNYLILLTKICEALSLSKPAISGLSQYLKQLREKLEVISPETMSILASPAADSFENYVNNEYMMELESLGLCEKSLLELQKLTHEFQDDFSAIHNAMQQIKAKSRERRDYLKHLKSQQTMTELE